MCTRFIPSWLCEAYSVLTLGSASGQPIIRKGGAVVGFVGASLKPYRRPGATSQNVL
jgi:hypothetical protein